MRLKLLVLLALALAVVQGSAAQSVLLKGDIDDNGLVNIADVTEVINVLLEGRSDLYADINEDGRVSIADVTGLINRILSGPDLRLCTYMLVSTRSGEAYEHLLDENTKVKIVNSELVLESDGHVTSYLLSELEQLRYEDRVVCFDCDPEGIVIWGVEDSQTINTLQP